MGFIGMHGGHPPFLFGSYALRVRGDFLLSAERVLRSLGFRVVAPHADEDEEDFDGDEGDGAGEAAAAEAVAVQTHAEDEVHPIPGHDDALEGKDGADGHAKSSPFAGDAAVEQEQVAEQRNERPGFLGVPIPEAAPGVVRPNRAEDGADGEEEDSDLEGAVEVIV